MAEVEVIIRDSILYETQPDDQLLSLFFPTQTITARELIRERVYREVQAYNDHTSDVFKGLVAPSESERVLNGFKLPKKRSVDPHKQFILACHAFEQNGFILLVDDQQVSQLDEKIQIHSGSSVVFLKLTPLVGG